MRILQVSDLHLGRSFEGLKNIPEKLWPQILTENKRTYEAIIQLALSQQVDVVLFCGDTFHETKISLNIQDYFIKGLKKLQRAGIKGVLAFGNHDYYTPEAFWFNWPDNITLFKKEEVEVKTLDVSGEILEVAAFSYTHPTLEKDFSSDFPPRGKNYRIGIYHGEEKENSPYAPFKLAALKNLHYDYFALGHIHVPQILSQTPPIVYGGTPLGHTKKETQVKGVVLVELKKEAPTTFEFFPVAQLTFASETLRLTGKTSGENLQEILTFFKNYATKTWKILQLTLQGDTLPETWQEKLASGELLGYLQGELNQGNYPIFLQDLTLELAATDKIFLPLEKEQVLPYQKIYANQEVFQKTLEDFLSQEKLRQLVANPEFKEEVLHQVFTTITENFDFLKEEKN